MGVERDDRAMTASRGTKLLLCSLAALAAAMGVRTAALSQTPPLVRVDGGELQGVIADEVVSFKGIPFAAPPVGDLRWRPPQPLAGGRACARPRNSGRTACSDGSARRHRPRQERSLLRFPPRIASS